MGLPETNLIIVIFSSVRPRKTRLLFFLIFGFMDEDQKSLMLMWMPLDESTPPGQIFGAATWPQSNCLPNTKNGSHTKVLDIED